MAECNHVYPGCVCAQSDLAEKDAEIARLRAEKEALVEKLRLNLDGVVALLEDPATGDVGRTGALNLTRAALALTEEATGG